MSYRSLHFAIEPLSRDIEGAVQNKIDLKTKPPGALGRLESLALQICLIQRTLSPQLRPPQMLVFAADHGAVAAGISAFAQDVTWQMVMNFLNGGAAINVFCGQSGIEVTVIDAGVNYEFPPHAKLRAAKIARGTANYVHEPAMTRAQCLLAIERGAQLARECLARGANVLACGEMGIGNTSAAALLLHRLAHAPLAQCVGRGTGLDDAGLARKREVLAAASRRCPGKLSALEALSEYGGFEIAMMVGAFLAAAEARLLILVDGFIASSAMLVAARLYPAVLDYCVFSHCSAEHGHRLLLEHLGVTPLLRLEMRLGEGTGAAVCYPIVRAAVSFLNEMASFDEAGVSSRTEM